MKPPRGNMVRTSVNSHTDNITRSWCGESLWLLCKWYITPIPPRSEIRTNSILTAPHFSWNKLETGHLKTAFASASTIFLLSSIQVRSMRAICLIYYQFTLAFTLLNHFKNLKNGHLPVLLLLFCKVAILLWRKAVYHIICTKQVPNHTRRLYCCFLGHNSNYANSHSLRSDHDILSPNIHFRLCTLFLWGGAIEILLTSCNSLCLLLPPPHPSG